MAEQHDILPSWKYFTSFHRGLLSHCHHCPPRPYLSLQIPKEEETPGNNVIVRRAVFTTLSHDQGFSSSYPHLNGTYEDSNTWFDICIVDRLGQDRVLPEPFARNRRASPEFSERVVCWDFRDHSFWFQGEHDELPSHASGLIPAQWLSMIHSGDTIQLVPRAQFSAWVNFIVEARIELWVEVVQTGPSLERRLTANLRTSYEPLQKDSKEIRVVVIEPDDDDLDSQIQLTLRRTDLTNPDHIQYEALSYCWGSEQSAIPILLTNENQGRSVQVPISANLERAIKSIRRRDQARIFWIDLLCINQKDLEERGEQVALMAEIYASAESVSVWLGEVDEVVHTGLDMEKIQSIAAASERNTVWEDAHAVIRAGGITFWHNDRVFLRPWFQRVWVLQEVWNAASAIRDKNADKVHRVSVLCGPLSVPWWVIMQANACLFNGYRAQRNNTMPSLWMELFDIPRKLNKAMEVKPRARQDILTTVIQGLDFKATDARDRLFALLAFGRETYRIAELPVLVKPNYNKTPAQVYCDFSLWWIKEYKSLRILSAIHTLRNRTWVDLSGDHAFRSNDDWLESAEEPSWTLWSNGNSAWARGTLALSEPVPFRACGKHPLDVNLLEVSQPFDFGKISTRFVPAFRGVQISSISSIEPFSLSQFDLPELSEMTKAYMRIFDPTGNQETWRNTGSSLGEAEEPTSREFRFALYNHLENHSRSGMYPREWLPCLGRCVLRTRDGRVGLCPSGARAGDLIVILYGGLVPYLLRARETPGFYAFIGECYLDGLMNGEAFDPPSFKEAIFRLI